MKAFGGFQKCFVRLLSSVELSSLESPRSFWVVPLRAFGRLEKPQKLFCMTQKAFKALLRVSSDLWIPSESSLKPSDLNESSEGAA